MKTSRKNIYLLYTTQRWLQLFRDCGLPDRGVAVTAVLNVPGDGTVHAGEEFFRPGFDSPRHKAETG